MIFFILSFEKYILYADATEEQKAKSSGLSTKLKYNHCYDAAASDQGNLVCEEGFTSTGANKNVYIYTGGYGEKDSSYIVMFPEKSSFLLY